MREAVHGYGYGDEGERIVRQRVTLSPVQGMPVSFESEPVDEHVFLDVLDEVGRALEEEEIPYALMGGIGSAVLGRPRWTRDIDVFVRAQDAEGVLTTLSRRGFAIDKTNPHWIYKCKRDGVLVDVIFRAKGDIYLDEEMESRIVRTSFRGRPVRVIPPEDLIVIKAIIHDEETPRHWYDAIGVIASPDVDIDWDYLTRRASSGARRVLSLLVYAQSIDTLVPDAVIGKLFETVYPRT